MKLPIRSIRNYVDLAFEPPLEKEFKAHYLDQSIKIVRFGIILAIVLYALFGILDEYMLPQTRNIAWTIRFLLVVPFLILILAGSFRPFFKRWFVELVIMASLIIGGGIILMMYCSSPIEPGHKYYYTGLLLVIIWVGTFSQLQFRHVGLVLLLIILSYAYIVMFRQHMVFGGFDNPNFPLFLNNSFFLIGGVILAIFCSLSFEKAKRNEFLQSKKIETLFGQQVSKEVLNELVQSGDLNTKLCRVTVMFVDIRDFSTFADSRLPQEVASFQNIVFNELINIVHGQRGIVNQFLGDGIMAIFGAPVCTETHVMDAVKAGFRILDKIDQLGNEHKIPPIRIGIGLHTGKVLAGNIGNHLRKQYSITGTNVNIASRIEQLNKKYNSQFLLSGAVFQDICNEYAPSFIGAVTLKGIKNPIKIYQMA